MSILIETPRLLLRPFTDGDAEAVYAYASHPEVGPPAGWKPHADVAESLEVIHTIFQPSNALAMVLKDSGRLVGSAGFVDRHEPGLGLPSEEIGYSLARDLWGQGLTTEAVGAIIRYTFTEMDYTALWAEYYEDNLRSRRVMEKCGMTYRFSRKETIPQGTEERMGHYLAITRQEWLNLQKKWAEEAG